MAKTLVIFDIDGTLAYSNKIDSQCFAQTYRSIYGLEFPTIDWTKYPHVTDTTIFKTVIQSHFDREVEEGEAESFQHQFVAMLEERRLAKPEEFQEVPHARRTIARMLDDERFVIGIGTGGWLRPAKVKLKHVEIPVDYIILAGADGHEQREGIIGQVVDAAVASNEVERTVYVGDAIWDVDTTRRMGMNFIGIRIKGDLDVLRKVGTSQVFQDYRNYGRFVEAIFEATPPKSI